jgi:hypothetical protein
MRALLSLLWSPSRQSATPFAVVREPNRQDGVEYYRAVLAEIAANDTAYMKLPLDLPEPIHRAIEDWGTAAGVHFSQ